MGNEDIKLTVTEQKRGKLVQLNCSILSKGSIGSLDSMSYNIGCWAIVRFEFSFINKNQSYTVTPSISYKKHDSQKDPNIQISLTCSMDMNTRHFLCNEEWSAFTNMGEVNFSEKIAYTVHGAYNNTTITQFLFVLRFSFSVRITDGLPCNILYILYNDDTFTDFCLKPEGGGSGVPMHKSIMAAHSDVFNSMLSGEWKETRRNSLEMKGVTQKTLQHLKDFMYLGSLPDDLDLRPLAVLAKCYMMDRLEKACVEKLAHTVKAEDLPDLVKFASDNSLYNLFMAILHNTSDKNIDASATKAAEVKEKEV